MITICGQILVSRTDDDPPPRRRVSIQNVPCVRSKRHRVCWHHAHTCFNMCAWCRYTRGRFERTHGHVLNGHTGFQACHTTHTTLHTIPHTPHYTPLLVLRVNGCLFRLMVRSTDLSATVCNKRIVQGSKARECERKTQQHFDTPQPDCGFFWMHLHGLIGSLATCCTGARTLAVCEAGDNIRCC